MPAYPYYYPGYYSQPAPQQMQPQSAPIQQTQQMQPQQIQNGGFVSVPSEDVVNTYPVAPGNCVTFKIEGKPIVMEKSMSFSQFENPKIDRYRLVKEDFQIEETKEELNKENEELKEEIKHLKEELKMTDEDLDELREDIKSLWGEIDVLKQPKRSSKRDKDGDD